MEPTQTVAHCSQRDGNVAEDERMAPISANFAGSMMMLAPIMLREVRSVSCVTLIFLLGIYAS